MIRPAPRNCPICSKKMFIFSNRDYFCKASDHEYDESFINGQKCSYLSLKKYCVTISQEQNRIAIRKIHESSFIFESSIENAESLSLYTEEDIENFLLLR